MDVAHPDSDPVDDVCFIPKGSPSTTQLRQVYSTLIPARSAAIEANYDTVLLRDVVGGGDRLLTGTKQFMAGNWDDLVREMYLMDYHKRHFCEAVFSSPLRRLSATSTVVQCDRGQYAVRFVMDIDCKIQQRATERWKQVALFLCRTHATLTKKDVCLAEHAPLIETMLQELTAKLFDESTRDGQLAQLRNMVHQWVDEGLDALGMTNHQRKDCQMLDASCFRPISDDNPTPECKLSLHIHYPFLLLRAHALDAALLARALNAVMVGKLLGKAGAFSEEMNADSLFLVEICMCALLLQHVPGLDDGKIEGQKWRPWKGTRKALTQMGILDEAVYHESQSFRIWLSSKAGQQRPLLRVLEDGLVERLETVTYDTFVQGMDQLRIRFLPKRLGLDENVFILGTELTLSEHLPPLSPSCLRRYALREPADAPDRTGMDWRKTELCMEFLQGLWSVYEIPAGFPTTSMTAQGPSSHIASTGSRNQGGTTSFRIVDDDCSVIDPSGAGIFAKDMQAGLFYHCEKCDFTGSGGAPDLNPSARCYITQDRNLSLWCFSCATMTIVRPILNYSGFCEETDVNVNTISPHPSNGYFPLDRLDEIVGPSLQPPAAAHNADSSWSGLLVRKDRPLIAINASMGSRKTYAAAKVSEHVEWLLVLTHRRSLARELATRFNAKCYLDELESNPSLDNLPRLVLCVNSLWRLEGKERMYELVIVDEAGFVRRHLCGKTLPSNEIRPPSSLGDSDRNIMNSARNSSPISSANSARNMSHSDASGGEHPNEPASRPCQHKRRMRPREDAKSDWKFTSEGIVCALSKFLHHADCLLLMQDGLSDDDVHMYNQLRRRGSRHIHKMAFRSHTLPTYEQIDDDTVWLAELVHSTQICKRRVFVACSQRIDATQLFLFFQKHYATPETSERIALVAGDVLEPKAKLKSYSDFVENFRDYDIVFTISCLETGVSLTGHYDEVFGHFRRTPLAYPSQVQLMHRVRDATRRIVYLEPGYIFAFMTNMKHMKTVWLDALLTRTTNRVVSQQTHLESAPHRLERTFLVSTTMTCTAESQDVRNNNVHIWRRNRRLIPAILQNTLCSDREQLSALFDSLKLCKTNARTTIQTVILTTLGYIEEEPLGTEIELSDSLVAIEESACEQSGVRNLHDAQSFWLVGALDVARACAYHTENGARKKRGGARNAQFFHDKILRQSQTVTSYFVYAALIDYVGLSKRFAANSPALAQAREESYWSQIYAWMCAQGASSSVDTQNKQNVVVEVLLFSRVLEEMYGTIFPKDSANWLQTVGNWERVCGAMEQWNIPQDFPKSSLHSCESRRGLGRRASGLSQLRKAEAEYRRDPSDKQKQKALTKARRTLGTSLFWKLADRIPITFRVYGARQNGGECFSKKVRKWTTTTLALACLGVKPDCLPLCTEFVEWRNWRCFPALEGVDKEIHRFQYNPAVVAQDQPGSPMDATDRSSVEGEPGPSAQESGGSTLTAFLDAAHGLQNDLDELHARGAFRYKDIFEGL